MLRIYERVCGKCYRFVRTLHVAGVIFALSALSCVLHQMRCAALAQLHCRKLSVSGCCNVPRIAMFDSVCVLAVGWLAVTVLHDLYIWSHKMLHGTAAASQLNSDVTGVTRPSKPLILLLHLL
jgi:hypothetical protein